MTALGGCIDWAQQTDCRSECIAILEAQSSYSSNPPGVKAHSYGSFGTALFQTLPEDRFDRQPLHEGKLHLVADVRLDNRDDLIEMVGISRSAARELADSDILLRAWLRWGEDSLNKIVGDYAFAAFSTDQRKLTLVRDPIGERPLFFARIRNRVAFASLPSGLLALPGFATELDIAALRDVATGIPASDGYFRGITKVSAGECINFTQDRKTSRTFWNPSLEPLGLKSPDEYTEAFREVLDTAVASRLRRRSGPISADLSSGFDSSAVAATAARIASPDKVIGLTAAPRENFAIEPPRVRFADESKIAGVTARMNGIRHVIVRPSGKLFSRMRPRIEANQDPYYNFVNLGWIADVDEAVRDSGSMIELSGEYGNLTLHAGGLKILSDLITQHRWQTWLREAWLASSNPNVRWRGILINSFETRLPTGITAALYRWSARARPRAQSIFLRPEWIPKGRKLEADYVGQLSGDSYADRLHYLRASDLGQLRKGNLALSGVDQRAPLGDRRVIEFSLRLPREQLLSDGQFRPLARRALRDRLPAEVLDATSRGYQAADWFEHFDVREIRELVDEISASTTARDLIDTEKMHRVLDEWPRSGFEGMDAYQRLALDLPMAIGTGLFILDAERRMTAKSS